MTDVCDPTSQLTWLSIHIRSSIETYERYRSDFALPLSSTGNLNPFYIKRLPPADAAITVNNDPLGFEQDQSLGPYIQSNKTLRDRCYLDKLKVGAGCQRHHSAIKSRLANARDCRDPLPIANTYRWITSGRVEYKCVESYNMTEGDGVLTCESDGNWVGQLPACDLYCGRAPQSPGTLWPAQITNEAMVNYNPGIEIAEAIYSCKYQLSDTDLYQENKVLCDRANGQWKSPANVFCKNESSLPLVDWLSDPIFLEESNSSILNITNDTLSADSDSTFLDYLMNECYEMVNSPSFAEIIFPLLPKGRDFELTSLELRLQSIHSNNECIEQSSNGWGIDYIGTTNFTSLNLTCQAWAEMTPHNHKYTTPDLFPDATFYDVKNYCRNPHKGSYKERPWCFTTDPNVEWDYCDIPVCHEFIVEVSVGNASDGGSDLDCGELKFYTSDERTNWTLPCPQSPTGPFGTELKIVADAAHPLFLCDVRPHGVESVSGCSEPPHKRGWTMVSLSGYALGDVASYTCAQGFHYKQGSKKAECTRARMWNGPFLECSDERNLALDGSTLRDNNLQTCATIVSNDVTDILLSNFMEVREVVLSLQGGQGPSTNYGDIPEVNAIIHDGTERLLYEVTFTDEGYLVKSPFNPITDRLTLSVTADLNICEIAIFGRNSSDTLECTTQLSGAADYKGNLSVSKDGHKCIPWTEHSRIADFIFGDGDSSYVSNYCRNPFDLRDNALYSGSRTICFYRDSLGTMKKDYCEVFSCEYGCRNDRSGVDYRGELNYVGTDHRDTCERWDAGEHRFSRKVDFAGGTTNHNGCRNPGRSQEHVWCIIDSRVYPVFYSYCNIPECPKSTEIEWTVSTDLNNQTEIDDLYRMTSKNFRQCICTDKDHRSYAQPELFDKLAYSFCDSYAGEHKSLMCHHNVPAGEAALLGDGAKWSRIFIICPPNPDTIQPTLITEAPTHAMETSTDSPTVESESSTGGAAIANDSSTYSLIVDTETSTEPTQEVGSCPSGCNVACINVTTYDAAAKEKMQKLLEDNQKRMFVDKASLSKQKRKKTSAIDERPSSQATGAVAITILVTVFLFLMIGDIVAVTGYLINLVKDCL
ncbi:hypothetical protein RRG08_025428 [Elysia crispata]|uniref:Uncharacterized protein n=1 Tax=Elysia crispata TaxID=231223 RepID=A0AAE0ZAJ8_9GAST|nr:hypothetical protein RRG08_025428 [Elysia crispata]